MRSYSQAPLYQVKILDTPVLTRLAQLLIEYNRAGSISQWNLHVVGIGPLERWIRRIDGYHAVEEMDEMEYRLSAEREEDFAWGDENIGNVAIYDGDDRLYANLGYNASTGPHDHGVNKMAQIHHTTPEFDRLALSTWRPSFLQPGRVELPEFPQVVL